MQKLTSFKKLTQSYQGIFFDAYGILNGVGGMLPGVAEALLALNKANFPYFVLSNDCSTAIENISKKYFDAKLGQLIPPEKIICSGLIAQNYLTQERNQSRIVYLGQSMSRCFLEGAAKELTFLGEANDKTQADIFAVMSVNGYDWQTSLNHAVDFIRRRPDMELISPNPDLVFFAGDGKVGIASGAISSSLELICERKFRYFGKPYSDIFAFGLSEMRKTVPQITPSQILMVGDNLHTDIKGANDFGLASVLCLSGTTSAKTYLDEIRRSGYEPKYVCESVTT